MAKDGGENPITLFNIVSTQMWFVVPVLILIACVVDAASVFATTPVM